MASFNFRLEQVRLYRKQLEDQAMQELAAALIGRDNLIRRIAELEQSAAGQRAILCKPETLPFAERWVTMTYLDALLLDARQAGLDLARAETHVDACRTNLVERAKEREMLDSLKKKQTEQHLLRESQQEQKINDETATLRYKPAAV